MAARVRLYKSAILAVQTDESYAAARRGARAFQRKARLFAPKDTLRLEQSIELTTTRTGPVTRIKVGSDLDYARWQNDGTGPIHAKPGGVLVFKVGGKKVFARRTRGVPATRFMQRAKATMTIADFR